MDQDETWHGGRPPSRPHCGTQLPLPKGGKRLDGGTGRPRPRRLCVRWGSSSPLKGAQHASLFGSCLLWPDPCWMGQYVSWHGGRPRPGHCHIVLDGDGDPDPPQRGTSASLCSPVAAKRWPISAAAQRFYFFFEKYAPVEANKNCAASHFSGRRRGVLGIVFN